MSAALDHLAARVATDPAFLANALAEYARSKDLDDAALAAALGCPAAELTRLRLCGSPRPGQFLADVSAIAGRFGIDPTRLGEIVRLGQSLASLRTPQTAEGVPGFLLAARDDDRGPPPEGEGQP
jgi:hypothetical protein